MQKLCSNHAKEHYLINKDPSTNATALHASSELDATEVSMPTPEWLT
jgi:hypothetical protein